MSRHPRGIFERPTGSGIYWIHWHDENGQRHREKVGPKQLAIAAYQRRKSDVRSGKFFPELRLRSVQFEQLCTDFQKSYPKHWSKGTFTLCSAWFGALPAVRITPQLIAERLSKTKNGKRRFVHLNTSAQAAVNLLRKQDGHSNQVCASDGIWFKQVLRKAGIEHFRWHDLRHTFASRLCMAGVDLRTIQELMGHESISMTVRYAHLSESHLQKAIEQIAAPAPSGLRIAARWEGRA